MSSDELQNVYNENAQSIIDRYRELVDQTRATLFPLWKFTWIAEPNLEGMSKSQVQFAEALTPYLYLDLTLSAGWRRSLSSLLWFVLFLLWAGLLIGTLRLITLEPLNSSPVETQPVPQNLWTQVPTAILLVLPPVLMYGYTVWFLTTRRSSWKTKALWLLSFLVFLVYVYSQLRNVSLSERNAILASPLFEFILFFLLIPGTLYIVYNLLYFGKFLIELIANALNAFVHAHQPVSFQVLRKVVINPVKSDKVDWHFLERSREEINTFKELAAINLEATEKKTIPTVILIGVFGFLATLPAFQQFFANGIQESLSWILELITGNAINITFGRIVFGVVAVILIVLILAANIAVVQNLFVQGIIVQACMIAAYSQKQALLLASQEMKKQPIMTKILKLLVGLISSLAR